MSLLISVYLAVTYFLDLTETVVLIHIYVETVIFSECLMKNKFSSSVYKKETYVTFKKSCIVILNQFNASLLNTSIYLFCTKILLVPHF